MNIQLDYKKKCYNEIRTDEKKENCARLTEMQFTVLKWELSAKRIQLRNDYSECDVCECVQIRRTSNKKKSYFLDTCQCHLCDNI